MTKCAEYRAAGLDFHCCQSCHWDADEGYETSWIQSPFGWDDQREDRVCCGCAQAVASDDTQTLDHETGELTPIIEDGDAKEPAAGQSVARRMGNRVAP